MVIAIFFGDNDVILIKYKVNTTNTTTIGPLLPVKTQIALNKINNNFCTRDNFQLLLIKINIICSEQSLPSHIALPTTSPNLPPTLKPEINIPI